MKDSETIKNARKSETIGSYKKLRLMQREIVGIKNSVDLVGLHLLPAPTITPLSNAVDQIEQALEKIKVTTTDSIVLEILNEIDGEITY